MTANYSLPSQDLAFIHKKLSEQVGMPRGSILITGATGFFGRWVLEALTWIKESESLPLRISALVRSAGQFRSAMSDPVNESTHLIESDMATAISTDETYDYVLHMASPKISPDDPRSFHEHLVKGAQGMSQVIALARRSPHCRVLFTSSGAVYGDYWKGSGSFSENFKVLDDSLDEKLVYSQTKRYLELMLLTAAKHHAFHANIARCFTFVGPYLPLDSNYAIGNFLRNALDKESIVIQGDGQILRSYLYTADLVLSLLLILFKGSDGAAYNVGSSEAKSLLQIAQIISALEPGCQVQTLNRNISPGAGSAYLPDMSRYQQEFGVAQQHSIEDAIEKTYRWHLERRSTPS